MSIVDTPIDRLLRSRHIQRLHTLADHYEDMAYEAAAAYGLKRGRYNEYWADRTRAEATFVAQEPMRKLLRRLP